MMSEIHAFGNNPQSEFFTYLSTPLPVTNNLIT
jgi:hypothetical protein